jgi:hypothetical protein
MTGRRMEGPIDGIYDDGEWISWKWIYRQVHEQNLRETYPFVHPERARLFESLVKNAAEYHAMTGRYLEIWGELGELYAEVKHGIRRHRPRVSGSDGRRGNDFIEIKTISPEKSSDRVQVKRSGNFNKLLVVKITKEFEFQSRIIDRKRLNKTTGKHMKVSWSDLPDPPPSPTGWVCENTTKF